MLIKGTGKVEKFDVLGVNVYDISMDSGEDLADLLADHEGQRVKVFIFDTGEAEELIEYAEQQGQKAIKLSEEIKALESRVNEMSETDEKGNALSIVQAGVALAVKSMQLNLIFNELAAMVEADV